MSRQDIANLAFKITGLYCLIQFISQLQGLLGLIAIVSRVTSTPGMPGLSEGGWWLIPLFSVVPPGLLAILAYVLITRSRSLAQRIFADAPPETPTGSTLAVHALAFSIVGIFAIVDAMPALVAGLVGLALSASGWGMNRPEAWVSLITPVLELGLGIVLFLRCHYLVRWWSQLRYAGIRDKVGICLHCGYNLIGNTSGVCPECGTPYPRTGLPEREDDAGM